MLYVVIAAHRLVYAEGTHKAGNGGGHAVARVRVYVVGAEARLVEFGSGVALPNRPLAGAEHPHRRRPLLAQHLLEVRRHLGECALPRHRLELALLVEFAALHAQQRRGQAVFAVHNLGEEVALHAVQAAVDRGVDVAVRGDNLVPLRADHHGAPRAAKPARRLVPADARLRRRRLHIGRRRSARASRRHGDRRRLHLDELPPPLIHGQHPPLGRHRSNPPSSPPRWRRGR